MIPKIIHYCWFGGKPIPSKFQKYIAEWKVLMPDYRIIQWDETNFDYKKYPFTLQAYEAGKLAYVADYCRLFALYTMGGVYLDTDIKVRKRFDEYLDCNFFSSYECHLKPGRKPVGVDEDGIKIDKNQLKVIDCGIMSAAMASAPNTQYIKECLDFYNSITFSYVMQNRQTIPTVLANHAEKYGFVYADKMQHLKDGINIYPSNVFANYDNYDRHSVTIHYVAGSWNEKSLYQILRGRLYRINWLRKIVFAVKY